MKINLERSHTQAIGIEKRVIGATVAICRHADNLTPSLTRKLVQDDVDTACRHAACGIEDMSGKCRQSILLSGPVANGELAVMLTSGAHHQAHASMHGMPR